jgi:regulatory protein
MRDERPPSPRPSPRPYDAARLERSALSYLERYAASAGHLRRVLERRIRRTGADPADGTPMIDAVIARLQGLGLVDDRRYAEAKAAALARRGGSARAIRARLGEAGVERPLIEAALAARDDDPAHAERAAAVAHARRKRLGPFRDDTSPGRGRADRRQHDIAAMARAGFAVALCRAVVDATDPESAAAWVEDA